jgi:glyoxylase-like metal-dependent hydrolase (beta-lactamase superfamily II)
LREIVDRGEVRVSLLDSTRGSYAYLVEDASHAILVDAGFTGKGPAILAELKGAGKTLTDIVITHYDVDHVGSLKALEDAGDVRIRLPADDAPYILGEKPRPGIKRLIGAVVRAAPPARWTPIRGGERVGPLTAVASAGHTPGHLAYQGPGFLLVGDAITTRGGGAGPSPAMLAWNAKLMRTTAAGLLSGFRGWILPAHGEPLDVQG